MGGRLERDHSHDERDISAIQQAITSGITLIDTAEKYGAGGAEELVGKAIQGVERSTLFLTSKVLNTHLQPDDLHRSLEESLERLGTDYLDLYLIHHPSPNIPLIETMPILDKLIDDGRVRHIGVSNFSTERLKEAQAASHHPIVLNQVHLNLMYREADVSGLTDYCRDTEVVLQAWRPVRISSASEPLRTLNDNPPEILLNLAQKYGKTPIQIGINWLISRPLTGTVAMTTQPEQLAENLGGLGWQLSAEDHALLTREYPNQKIISDVEPLR